MQTPAIQPAVQPPKPTSWSLKGFLAEEAKRLSRPVDEVLNDIIRNTRLGVGR